MKKILPILLLVFVMCLSVCFAACQKDEAVTLSEIKVEKQPSKLSYNAGEKFVADGIKVVAIYSDGTTKDVTDKCTYTPYGTLNANNTKVTVRYSEEVNGEKVTKTAEISIRVAAAPVEEKVEILADMVNATPANMPHVLAATSKATQVFYTYYDSTSMKCEATLELTSTDATKGSFVYTEMSGHAYTSYKLGYIEGTYTIADGKMNFVAKAVHSVPNPNDSTQPISDKLTSAKTEVADIVYDGETIVGLNLGKASGNDKLWGWSKSNASNFVEGLATAHDLSADTIYMEKVVDGKLSANQKAYYVTESVGLYKDGDAYYGMPQDVLFEGDVLQFPAKMYVAVNYAVPSGSTEAKLNNLPIDSNYTLAIKRGEETLPVSTALAVGDKLLITYDGVQGEVELNVHANPTQPVLRSITLSNPYKSIYHFGDKIDLTGMKVTAHYTRGGADKEIALANCNVEVVGSTLSVADYTMGKNATVTVTYTEGDITVSESLQLSVSVLPWNVALQGDADFSYINYSKRAGNNDQEAFSAIQLYGNATSGKYYITILVTKDRWASVSKSSDYYVYVGNYTANGTEISFACPENIWLGKADGGMFYNPDATAASSAAINDFVKNGGVKATINTEDGVITEMEFLKDETNGFSSFFGFKNKSSYPMTFALVTNGQLPENIASIVPAIYPEQATTKTLVGMDIVSMPTKLVYTEGEKFDATGLKIVAYYNDGTFEVVANISFADKALTTDDTTVTVTAQLGNNTPYTFNFEITVKSAKATFVKTEVSGEYKKDYAQGEKFNADNLVVKAVYSDGSSVNITDFVIADVDKALVKGTTKLTLTYTLTDGDNTETKTAEIEITVGDALLQSIEVSGEYKKNYTEGETFDKTGLIVTATFTDGTRDVTSEATIADGDKALIVGASSVVVAYGEKSAEVKISVSSIQPWIRLETVTAERKFAAYVTRKNGTSNNNKHFAWIALEMYADGSFRTTSKFTTSNWTNEKTFVQIGTYTVDGNNVTFTLSAALETSGSAAFATTGIFKATLTDSGLNFAYGDDTAATIFGYTSLNNVSVTMTALTNGKLSLELLTAIPEGMRKVASLRTEGKPVTEYTEGDDFNAGELKVFAKYEDGAEYDVTSIVKYNPATKLTTDVTSIEVSYAGATTTVDGIVVKQAAAPTLNAIEVTAPAKTSYRVGEKLDLGGLVVTAKYTAGKADAVVTNYTLSFKDKDVAVTNGMYLGETVTLVVTYTEDEVTLTKEVEIVVTFVEPWEIAADKNSTADYLYVTYGIRKEGTKDNTKHYTWSAIELYGDLTTGGTYIVTNRFTTSNWLDGNNFIVYAGNYTVESGKIVFADPSKTFFFTDKSTSKFFYNPTQVDAVSGFEATIVDNGAQLQFEYTTTNTATDTFFQFGSLNNAKVVMERVVNGEIPASVKEKIPTIA